MEGEARVAELRKDFLLDEWVIVAPNRRGRPQDLGKDRLLPVRVPWDPHCPFCPGNEAHTPPEVARLGPKKNWRARAFANKYPAVTEQPVPGAARSSRLFHARAALGRHEVIVETPHHDLNLEDLPQRDIAEVLALYQERVRALEALPDTQEVNLFKNFGPDSGASLLHAHAQVIALNVPSPRKSRERLAFQAYQENYGTCPVCDLLKEEKGSRRWVYQNKYFACLAPFASRAPLELLFVPRRHTPRFPDLVHEERLGLAQCLQHALRAIASLEASYNYFLHAAAPHDHDFHLHLRLTPRLARWGGFEEQTGIIINTTAPEDAARFYRDFFPGGSRRP